MIGVESELRPVLLLTTQTEEPFDSRSAVRSVPPLARRTPLELRSLWRVVNASSYEERFDVDPCRQVAGASLLLGQSLELPTGNVAWTRFSPLRDRAPKIIAPL